MSALWLALLFGFANCGYAWDYGNGRHGTYVLTSSTTIEQLYQTVRLTNDPAQYNPSDSNAIPNFQNLIITNGATLTANSWNGSTGGQIILKVQATLLVAAGSSISASGIGYRGGGQYFTGQYTVGVQGESYAGSQNASPSANNGGGGGGGLYGTSNGNPIYFGAGGGGYGGQGASYYSGIYGYGGIGGGTYGTPDLGTVYLGSGGGGPSGPSGSGGNGGGAIVINAGSLQVAGQIQAAGNNANGGGGSGGSIKLQVATANIGASLITANGGSGSGSGGVGRIAIYYAENYSGTSSPAAYTLLDTNSDNVTIITNQPAAQTSFLSSNAVFSVGITGFSPLFFQWSFNNSPISGATNQTLSLVNLAFTNQGNYSVAISNVVGTVVSSNAFLTVLDPRNPFGDGIPNWWKTQYSLSLTDPTLATNYPSGDKLTYLEKYLYGLNPLTNDTDGDGLTDYDEIFIYHTNPLLADTDGDGIPDGWEVQHGLNPLVNDATQIGSDGVSNLQIYQYDKTNSTQLDPRNPFFAPGTSIYEVLNNGQHTNRFYYDHEDRLVGVETSRGISIAYTYDGNSNLKRQTVLSRAGETNGLPVLWQFLNGLTNGTTASGPYGDPDGDGWSNYQEWLAGTDPNNLQSIPSLLNNPGTNIASITFPFTPSNCVVAAGQLNGIVGDEIVVGADGNATGKTNSLFILTQGASSWQVQQLPVGSFGVTSIAVGQPTNRPSPAIYVGLRGTNGNGQIMEFMNNGGIWQSNVIASSTNPAAFVIGVRANNDLLASLSATNGQDGALYSFVYSNPVWNQFLVSSNGSHRISGNIGTVLGGVSRQAGFRLLDGGGIEISGLGKEFLNNRSLIPSNSVYYAKSDKWYFQTTPNLDWFTAESACQAQNGSLVTISSPDENQWLHSTFPFSFHIGKYFTLTYENTGFVFADSGWISGIASTYYDWALGQPSLYVNPSINPVTMSTYMGTDGYWYTEVASQGAGGFNANHLCGVGEFGSAGGLSILPEATVSSKITQDNSSLLPCFTRVQTNGFSILYACVDDKNQSGTIDTGDDFVLEELVVTTNSWTTNTFNRRALVSSQVSQHYGMATADLTGVNSTIPFTAEPDGQIFYWNATNSTTPLQRNLFSSDYLGDAWHSLTGVKTSGLGQGLAGLMVSPTNQNVCNVIFWSPQAVLPTPQPSLIETAPSAAVIPSANPLGSNAVVTIRLWDNEGNASTPFLQYQFLGSTTWQNVTLTTLDAAPYNLAMRVTALPTGNAHTVGWNALADVGANIVTNILLRASAQDFMLTGNWSVGTPFQLNTTVATVSNPTNPPVNFTGITPVQGGIQFNWQGGSNAWLYLQRSPALAGTNVNWVNIWTGAPPTPISGSYTDSFGTNAMEFYRMKIVSP